MLKKIVALASILVSNLTLAANPIDLYSAPLSSLSQFNFASKAKGALRGNGSTEPKHNSLQQINQTQENNKTIIRYQQKYQGIPIVGAQVMISKNTIPDTKTNSQGNEVNGHLFQDIQISTKPSLSSDRAMTLAKQAYFSQNQQVETYNEVSELQIRPISDTHLKLVYLVSFKTVEADNKPAWLFFVIDAQTGEITQQWNNIKTYLDSGPGGNEKVHEYWYGKDGLPGLNVTKKGSVCVMESPNVKLVNLHSAWDWSGKNYKAFEYPCDANQEETVNGGFSPSNDAYFFGQTIVDMYQDWYGLNALQNADGTPMQLIMRVHFGTDYENAFWDGHMMSFGDGHSDFYPLVSLDVAGHEVTHGFTEQHSGLEYHDQSGALNESLSDMAGQASRAYLLEKMPDLYNRVYLEPNEMTWGIGETIVRDTIGKALRFMDYPSSDGSSADCLDKELAQSNGAYCAISYDEVVSTANERLSNPNEIENFIVHTASGVFNKAFYLLSQDFGVKRSYHLMIIANTKYWRPTTEFKDGACGVVHAAHDLNMDIAKVKLAFAKVGVDTEACLID